MNEIEGITVNTPVRHPDGGVYSIVGVASLHGRPTYYSIAKAGHGDIYFSGTPEQAMVEGFVFGDCEPGEGWLTLQLEAAVNEVETLRHELARANERVNEFRGREEAFGVRVWEAVSEAQKKHGLCNEGTNEFLAGLGLDPLVKTFTVAVTRGCDGRTVLIVTGIEAADETEAEDQVRAYFDVTAEVRRVWFTYSYDGAGDTNWVESDLDDREYEQEESEYANDHEDDLTFTATAT
jgi:hypothetical protein